MSPIPTILVHDWEDPPMTTVYIRGDNEVHVSSVYRAIKGLKSHEGRGNLSLVPAEDGNSSRKVLTECSEKFIGDFFSCCGYLLDYFADFQCLDSAYMHQLWFHLVDTLQEASRLPHEYWSDEYPACTHAEQFTRAYDQTVMLMNRTILARSPTNADGLIHQRERSAPTSSYAVGEFKPGVKTWQQFLLNGSPGCAFLSAVLPFNEEVSEVKDKICDRQVPMGALALVLRHTARARQVVEDYVDGNDGLDGDDFRRAFDAYTSNLHRKRMYASIAGHTTIAQPTQLSRASRTTLSRHNGLLDPALILPDPNLWMLNEAVGNYQGELPVEHPEGNDGFHMLRLTSSTSKSGTPDTKTVVDADNMFNDWKLG